MEQVFTFRRAPGFPMAGKRSPELYPTEASPRAIAISVIGAMAGCHLEDSNVSTTSLESRASPAATGKPKRLVKVRARCAACFRASAPKALDFEYTGKATLEKTQRTF